MGSHPRLKLSTDGTPLPSSATILWGSNSSARAPQTRQAGSSSNIGAVGHSSSPSGAPGKRTVQRQLSQFFPSASPQTSLRAPLSRTASMASASRLPHLGPRSPRSAAAIASPHHNSRTGCDQLAPCDDSAARHPKRRCISPASSMLGRAPHTTLRGPKSNTHRAETSEPNVIPSDDSDEEEKWMQRARMLTVRHPLNETATPLSTRRPKVLPSDATKEGASSSLKRFASSSTGAQAQRSHSNLLSPTPPPQTKESSSPLQETPWLHDSLSELSMLPWEKDAALKLPQYRNSTGSKVTERDLQVKKDMEQAMAQKARKEAIDRSVGDFVIGEAGAVRRQIFSSRSAISPSTSPKHYPLSVRSRPNHAKLKTGKRPLTAAIEDEEEENHAIQSLHCPAQRFPATPVPDLPALRSPRSKRKVYAIETQDGTPLPTVSDYRAAGIRRLPNRLQSGSPTTFRKWEQKGTSAVIDHPIPDPQSSPSQNRTRSPEIGSSWRDIDESPSVTPRKLRDHLLSTRYLSPRSKSKKKVRDVSDERSCSEEDDGGGYAADSSSPLPSAMETKPVESVYDEEADETVLPTTANQLSLQCAQGSPHVKASYGGKEDEDMDETQPLPFPASGETTEEEEEDLLVLRLPKRREWTGRHASERPVGWASVNAAWEGVNLSDAKQGQPNPTQHQPKLGHYGFKESSRDNRPSAGRQKPTLPQPHERLLFDHPLSRDVTDHLSDDDDGVAGDADDSGFVDGWQERGGGKGQDVCLKRDCESSHCPLSTIAVPSASLKSTPRETSILDRSMEVVPDSQATQPLTWSDDDDDAMAYREPRSDTHDTSHTEDEAEISTEVLRKMNAKLTDWPRRRCQNGSPSGDVQSGSKGIGVKGTPGTTRDGCVTSDRMCSSSSDNSDSWVPDVPAEVETFFRRL